MSGASLQRIDRRLPVNAFDRTDGLPLSSIWPPMRLLRSPGFFFAIALAAAVWLVPHHEGSVPSAHGVKCSASPAPLLTRAVELDPIGAHLKRCGCVKGSA